MFWGGYTTHGIPSQILWNFLSPEIAKFCRSLACRSLACRSKQTDRPKIVKPRRPPWITTNTREKSFDRGCILYRPCRIQLCTQNHEIMGVMQRHMAAHCGESTSLTPINPRRFLKSRPIGTAIIFRLPLPCGFSPWIYVDSRNE